ncbi:1-(5-phosphoribosyl)-5-[(5-phosphoribosylamino)methylideneamino]imidazole-4-carboxamide isomerase [Gilvibacter sediminis]|uniref:1-(5-phosphoribosyl)-5-[(5- phosphoribosylamino)methylideneamino]imidazole-4- carboxamide isomerase n=1 Tax=Gilvibacter sediminis TaxID=379071 RepID=UPI00235022B1|nr:1-(5-phosphoribosyl)-5-[(5-phosphoribosylamino)methylideneamino]imidazole-4-carboxamide isomerase [Gilvibacter sediminis]MDC7997895.1 1-(5-phosphoribosyl)-5-[(5-phosphoribosylamino)methylideneamino]imidazole-4-carboxamide isomerase [Gilvibacter sediminis]
MRIIPAIDLIEGKCVRLTQGDYNQKTVYNEDPLEVAKEFEAHGIEYLHLVDLDGAKSKRIVNHKVLERIATKTSLKIDFGGGVKSDEDIRIAFESGAQQVTGGSIAVSAPELFASWLKLYGSERLILGADCKDRMIATHGWQQASGLEVKEFIGQYLEKSVQYVICTDIAKDGMLQGPSFDLYQELLELEGIKLIASGGVTTLSELEQLQAMGCEGAIVGKAIYEGTIALKDLEKLC